MWKYVAVLFVVLLVHKIYCVFYRKLNNYPPGPDGIPFIGPIMFAIKKHKYFNTVAKQYSSYPILMFNCLGENFILINDLEQFQQTHRKYLYVDLMYKFTDPNKRHFIHINKKLWRIRRKMSVSCLNLVFTSNHINVAVSELLQQTLFKTIDKQIEENNNLYRCRKDIYWMIFALMFHSFYGCKIDNIPTKHSKEFNELVTNIQQELRSGMTVFMINKIPVEKIQKYLHSKFGGYRHNENVISQIRRWYHSHLQKDNKQNYFYHMQKNIDKKLLKQRQMLAGVASLFEAAIFTTGLVIEATLYTLCIYPEIQQRVYNELNEYESDEKGSFRSKDMKHLHLFRAFVHESMRYFPVSQTSPRTLTVGNGEKVAGYNIPNNATMLGNINYIHRKEKHWNHANVFCLENFLDENNKFKRNAAFNAFGYGDRNCTGKTIAMSEIYLILASLIFRYRFATPYDIDEFKIRIPDLNIANAEISKDLSMSVTRRLC